MDADCSPLQSAKPVGKTHGRGFLSAITMARTMDADCSGLQSAKPVVAWLDPQI